MDEFKRFETSPLGIHAGKSKVQGSRALKIVDDYKIAIRLIYAHKIAKVIFQNNRNVHVIQFKKMYRSEPKKWVKGKTEDPNRLIRKKGSMVLESSRREGDSLSREYFKSGDERTLHKHAVRMSLFRRLWLRQKLKAAGFASLDFGPHNIGVAENGHWIIYEVLPDDKKVSIEGPIKNWMFPKKTVLEIKRLREEYNSKLAEYEKRELRT